MAVTPLRATKGSSCQTVEWPTVIPPTSQIELLGPAGSDPIDTPNVWKRGRGAGGAIGRGVGSDVGSGVGIGGDATAALEAAVGIVMR